jgi:ribosomal protein L37E
MKCRRCGKELPVGQRTTCPHCGIYLNTIITPRGNAPKTKRKGNRALIMSFLSVGLVVAVVCIFVPFMRGITKNDMLTNIEDMFDTWNGAETEFSEDDWQKNLAVFSGAVDNFKRAYPKDEENVEKMERYLLILLGHDPDNLDPPEISGEQREFNNRLIRIAKDEILDILDLSASKDTLTVRFKNPSGSGIAEIRMEVEGFDASGKSIGVGHIRSKPIPAKTEEQYRFPVNGWSGQDAASARIVWLDVGYGPHLPNIYFMPEVCEVLWP